MLKTVLTAAALIVVVASPAGAVTCPVNIEQAFLTAQSRGWGFSCSRSTSLVFDRFKRIGCSGKTRFFVGPRQGNFFCRNSGLQNGWSLHSFKMVGGQFSVLDETNCLVQFEFHTSKTIGYSRRSLSELKLSKDGGDCSNAIQEAF